MDWKATGNRRLLKLNEMEGFRRNSLKPICTVWYHFLKSRLMLSTHNSTVFKEQILLLHLIIMRRKLNISKVIFHEEHWCAKKNAGSLNFPSLIISLYRMAKVLLNANEDVSSNKGGISRSICAKNPRSRNI
ncbi:hypothetical protein V6Z11_A13G103900 [Gossypium hirsutum]